MNMKLLGLAILGTLSANAMAQSSVSVYGSIDGGLRNLTNVNPAGDSQLTMASNGTFRSNRLGFMGSEDLGNGLKANFVLEAGFVTATGALNNTSNQLFQREARVGLSGDFGSLDLGRQYTIAYKTILAFDPFSYRYPSITYALSSTAGTRDSNAIVYGKRVGGLTVRAGYALGETAGSTANGSKGALGAVYAKGPVRLGAVYTRARQNVGTAASADYQDYDHYALGGAYLFGALTASVGYVNEKQATGALDNTAEWEWVGLSWKLRPGMSLTGAWYRNTVFNNLATAKAAAGDGRKDQYIIGMTYDFSKRTNFYAEVDVNKLDGAFARGGTKALDQTHQTGIAAGIMHMF
jgi:predicted porin